jgi:uncharacterized membrane protein
MQAEGLIRDYLRRLDLAASGLPPDRRDELTAEVRDHIDAALSEAGTRDEVTVRNVLERLGQPEEIVSAEAEIQAGGTDAAAVLPRAAAPASIGATEIAAILLLTVGSFLLPVVGPLIGLIFVWMSANWTRRHKLIATAIVAILIVVPIALFMSMGTGTGVTP